MKATKFMLIFILFLIFISCSQSDPLADAEKAMQNGDFVQAIKLFEEARLMDDYNQDNDYKIALAYLHNGEKIYARTRNIKSFIGNLEKAKDYIPETPTDEFKKQYSRFLFLIASAYNKAKPRNEIEKDRYFSQSINLLKEALETDSTNTSADSLLTQIKENHFKELIENGKNDYRKARKSGNVNFYFSAEYYLQQAAKFDPGNYEIKNYLHKIQENTLSVLNYKDGFSMAILSKKYKNKELILDVVIKNYLQEKIPVRLENFTLVDSDGNTYSIYQRGMDAQSLFGEKCVQDTVLTPQNSEIAGLLVFSVPEETKLSQLSYKVNNTRIYKKYFP